MKALKRMACLANEAYRSVWIPLEHPNFVGINCFLHSLGRVKVILKPIVKNVLHERLIVIPVLIVREIEAAFVLRKFDIHTVFIAWNA